MPVEIPKKFQRYVVAAGKFKEFDKVLLWGPEKSGKSRLAGGFPGPIGAIDTGEYGIEQYLQPSRGDVCMHITDPAETSVAFRWMCDQARAGHFRTLIVDSGTVFWDNTKDAGYDTLAAKGQADATYSDWAWIKKPTNSFLAQAMAVPANVVVTCWQKDTAAEQDKAAPGMKSKMKIKKVDVADIEKHFPYLFDYLYSLEQGEDEMGRPNGQFFVRFWGGRVPEAVPAGMLMPGKTWEFSAKTKLPMSEVYEKVIGWLRPYKEKGGVPTFIGVDEEEVGKAWMEIEQAATDERIGAVVRWLRGVKTAADYQARKDRELGPLVVGLDNELKLTVQGLINQKKSELGVE